MVMKKMNRTVSQDDIRKKAQELYENKKGKKV